jgi:hypothetical protein
MRATCVCVCVCVCEREREEEERKGGKGNEEGGVKERGGKTGGIQVGRWGNEDREAWKECLTSEIAPTFCSQRSPYTLAACLCACPGEGVPSSKEEEEAGRTEGCGEPAVEHVSERGGRGWEGGRLERPGGFWEAWGEEEDWGPCGAAAGLVP